MEGDREEESVLDHSARKGRRICLQSEKKAASTSMQLLSCKTTVESKKRKREITSTTATNWCLPRLPDDLIFFNILARLPVKSLSRFTSVSKLWCATVGGEDTEFVSAHTHHSKEKPPLILGVFHAHGGDRIPCTNCNFISFDSSFFQGSSYDCVMRAWMAAKLAPVKLSGYLRFGSARGAAKFFPVGYCNGLFCIRSTSGFEITNLSTREVLCLPPTPPLPSGSGRNVRYGFGYDPLKKEYKILQLANGKRCLVFTVSNSSSWTWRQVPVPPEVSSILHNYAHLHSITFSSDRYLALYSVRFLNWFLVFPEASIMSFNIHTEEFFINLPPQQFPTGLTRPFHYFFLVLEGRPCCGYQQDVCTDEVSYNVHLYWLLNDPSSNGANLEWGEQTIPLPSRGLQFPIGLTSFLDQLTFYSSDGKNSITFYHPHSKTYASVVFPPGPCFDLLPNRFIYHKECSDLLPNPFIYHKENLLSLKTFVPPDAGTHQVRYINRV